MPKSQPPRCQPSKNKHHKEPASNYSLAKPKPNDKGNNDLDVDSIVVQVQDSITKWVQCQVKDKLKSICKDKHYSIRVCDSSHVAICCVFAL